MPLNVLRLNLIAILESKACLFPVSNASDFSSSWADFVGKIVLIIVNEFVFTNIDDLIVNGGSCPII